MALGLLFLVVVVYLDYKYLAPKTLGNFPPGPARFPIVGSGPALTKLGKTGAEAFTRLGEIYGPVTGIGVGSLNGIVINGYEAIKAFFANDEFAHRPDMFTFSYRWGGRMLGVFFSNGRLWQEQRRFTLRHLRDFGFGKRSMEGLIHEECEDLNRSLEKAVKEAGSSSVITIHDRFTVSVINILWAIIAGVRYQHDDENLRKMFKVIQQTFRTGSVRGNIVNSSPVLRHIPPFREEFRLLTEGINQVIAMVQCAIDEHVGTRKPGSSEPARDLIDVYLDAMEEHKNNKDSTFFRDQLVQICTDFFAAGSESTSNSIGFALLHLLRNPECQEKVQQELDTVLGREKFISYEDRHSLPYTLATVTETFRMSTIAPVSVPHTCIRNVNFMGYDIPKDAFILVNFQSTNMDKEYWGDPENFRPERFLNADGTFDKTKVDHVLGFGAGEPLARICNFIVLTTVLQRFKFDLIPGQPKPTTDVIDGFTVAPHPFSAKVTTIR